MNIFVLDYDPEIAATQLIDKHVVKMVLESAQMLSTVCNLIAGYKVHEYKSTHVNRPNTNWLLESKANYDWLVKHGLAIAREYTKRYKKIHKSQAIIEWCRDNAPQLPNKGLTPFALVMPEKYRTNDAVESYQAYYKAEKLPLGKRTIVNSHWENFQAGLSEYRQLQKEAKALKQQSLIDIDLRSKKEKLKLAIFKAKLILQEQKELGAITHV